MRYRKTFIQSFYSLFSYLFLLKLKRLSKTAIKEALKKEDPEEKRLTYIEIESADHGFRCEQRSSFNAEASKIGWGLLLEKLNA